MTSKRQDSNVTRGTSAGSAAGDAGRPDDAREQRRRELRIAECVRRGVRFLPAQVLRAAYEKAGLL